MRNWVYRLGAVCPGSRDKVSTRRQCFRVYEPKDLGLYVREMWVMRAEAGEVVVLLVCEDWLPPAAGRNMRVVGDMTAAIYMIEFKMLIFWF